MDPIQTRQPTLAQSAIGVGMIVSRVDLGVDTVEVLRKVVLDLSGIAFEGNVLEHLENVDDVVTLLLMVGVLGVHEFPDGGIVRTNAVIYVYRLVQLEV